MYLQYYGLRQQPFGVTPDPRYFYASATHREALASLLCGIECRVGFAALISEPGMGKTTLLFDLLQTYRSSAETVFIFNTQCTSHDLLREIIQELGIATVEDDLVRLHSDFRHFLIDRSRSKPVLLVIDEAQNLEDSVLETVRLLSDFETPNRKLLHIILAGQPQLAERLQQPRLAQLMQRITMISQLKRLSAEEVDEYIRRRLYVADYPGPNLFSPEAVTKISIHSKGIPRSINRICFNALLMGSAIGEKIISGNTIDQVTDDLDLKCTVKRKWTEPIVNQKREAIRIGDSHRPPQHRPPLKVSPGPAVETSAARSLGTSVAGSAPIRTSGQNAKSASELPVVNSWKQDAMPVHDLVTVTSGPEQNPISLVEPGMSAPANRAVRSVSEQLDNKPPHPNISASHAGQKRLFHTKLLTGTAALFLIAFIVHARNEIWPLLEATKRVAIVTLTAYTDKEGSSQTGSETWPQLAKAQPSPLSVDPAQPTDQHPNQATNTNRKKTERARIPVQFSSMPHPLPKVPTPMPRTTVGSPEPDPPVLTAAVRIGAPIPAALVNNIVLNPPKLAVYPDPTSVPTGIEPRKLVRWIRPLYPAAAKSGHIEGDVYLAVKVGKDGDVQNVRVDRGDPILAVAAVAAIQQWHYAPLSPDGEAALTEVNVKIQFRVQ